jgi:hypothetical protein
MSLSLDATLRALHDCGCCEGLSAETPVRHENRPGLTAIAYRAGTHALFKESLLSRLTTLPLSSLRALTARDDDDFSVALLDAWAVVCDVLTFYQERIANENYLRTATELVSAVALARLVDYHLQPGVAASVDLAFTLEEAPGALGQALGVSAITQSVPSPPLRLTLARGTKVQTIPGPGEQAQTFETVEPIEARAEWNAIVPRLRQPQVLNIATPGLVLQGTATNLQPGHALLIVTGPSTAALRRVRAVTIDDKTGTTTVMLGGGGVFPPAFVRPSPPKGNLNELATKVNLTEQVVQSKIISKAWSEEDLSAAVNIQGWDAEALVASVKEQTAQPAPAVGTGVFALRQRAAIFGHNAPKWGSLPASLRFGEVVKNKDKAEVVNQPAFPAPGWEDLTLKQDGTNQIFLDGVYLAATPGSLIALSPPSAAPGTEQVCRVQENVETTRAEFAISAKVSRLTVDFVAPNVSKLATFKMRETTVFVQSEELAVADLPIPNVVGGDSIVLNQLYLGLKAGQAVIVAGERADPKSTRSSEMRILKEVVVENGFTVVTFQKDLAYQYVRSTVTINANVAPATHGESVDEVLGSGSASQSFQRFALKQPPLTYVTAPTPSGGVSTLEVRANDLLWHEVPTLLGQGPEDRVYVTRTDETGGTTVLFGDGRTGARLPTGQENVRAKYRKGTGAAGLLPSHRITQLLSRPQGLKEATNPLPSTGGADPEKLDDVRRNAVLNIRTLGRIVSLQDYEDFARSFAGVAKSLATWTWSGNTRSVFVTIAGINGAEVKKDTPLYVNLTKAMLEAGDPTVPLAIESYTLRFFRLAGDVGIHPDFLPAMVLDAIREQLRRKFSFDAREFGQPVALSEVVAAIQEVSGVVFVDLNELYRSDLSPRPDPSPVVLASAPRPGAENPVGAELLTLDPRPIALRVRA